MVKAFVVAQDRASSRRGPAPGTARPCPQAARRGGGAEGNRVRRHAAAHPQRQDHAPPAQGARTRSARRRHSPRWSGRRRVIAPPPTGTGPLRTRTSRCACSPTCCASGASRRSARSSTAQGKIRGFLHLYIGEEAVAVGVMHALDAGGRRRRHLPRARPRAAARRADDGDHGRDVRQARRLLARPRRLDAPVRCAAPLLRRQRHRRRRAAAGGRAGAGRQAAGQRRASPPASSAKARWPKVPSTSR